jgi:hypothetical protein
MKARAAATIVAVAAVAVYWGALSSGFVGDDFMILHRLREAGGLPGAGRFFRGEFFEYYRPMGFVLHAADWSAAGPDPWHFHLTNVLIHALNSVLVFLIARELSPKTIAAPLAGLLFALHASNHEAVVWISARFDLLATAFSLAAIWLTVRWPARTGATMAASLLFLCAVLSKESAVALPIAVAGFFVFARGAATRDAVWRVLPWLGALVTYGVLRHLAGGVSAVGGTTRIPKLIAFLVVLAGVLLLGTQRWRSAQRTLRGRRAVLLGASFAALAVAAGIAAIGGRLGRLVAEKLAVSGFALFNLGSPWLDVFDVPFYLSPGTTAYWLGGVIAVAIALVVLGLAWRRLVEDERAWFLLAFLIAALLPISALTEGARYLYLPSAAFALMAGVLVGELPGHGRRLAVAACAVLVALSTAQIIVKVRDWQWAGRLTADGAHLVDTALAPSCGEGQVVFLTQPVAIRSVYTHFLYETFELPRGCMPAVFQVLVRVLRRDTTIEARWDGPSRVILTAREYRDNFSLSADLRNFDPPLPKGVTGSVQTPLGELRYETGTEARLTLTLPPSLDTARVRWFYYSDGAMRALAK